MPGVYGPARMSDAITYRPMAEGDFLAVHECNVRAFEALDVADGPRVPGAGARAANRRWCACAGCSPPTPAASGWPSTTARSPARRWRSCARGCGGCRCCSPTRRSRAAASAASCCALARAYGDGARGWVILSSVDPWAMRAYARLGLAMHPSVSALGRPQGVEMPAGLRDGGAEDLPLTIAVDRAVRGAARGDDVLAMLEAGNTLLVAPERGYAILRGSRGPPGRRIRRGRRPGPAARRRSRGSRPEAARPMCTGSHPPRAGRSACAWMRGCACTRTPVACSSAATWGRSTPTSRPARTSRVLFLTPVSLLRRN